MIDYEGVNIVIEEMPQGCVILDKNTHKQITITSTHDALALISSLRKMLKTIGEEDDE